MSSEPNEPISIPGIKGDARKYVERKIEPNKPILAIRDSYQQTFPYENPIWEGKVKLGDSEISIGWDDVESLKSTDMLNYVRQLELSNHLHPVVLRKLQLSSADTTVVDVESLLPSDVKIIFFPSDVLRADLSRFHRDQKIVTIVGNLADFRAALLLLHEIGHVNDPFAANNGTVLEAEIKTYEKDPENNGKDLETKVAAESLRNERYAWSFALRILRQFLKGNNPLLSKAELTEFIHWYSLQSYSNSVRDGNFSENS